MRITVGTDCSGIEAPIQALRMLGVDHEHVFSSDIDPNCRKVIREVYAPRIIYDNIFREEQPPGVDLYVAGFPCQPFSSLGAQLGSEHPEGTVFSGVLEYIRTRRPRHYILENVVALKTHDKGRTFRAIMGALEGVEGYQVTSVTLNTRDFGLPQSRTRVYILGTQGDLPELGPWEGPCLDLEDIRDSDPDPPVAICDWNRRNLDHWIKTVPDFQETPYVVGIGESIDYGRPKKGYSRCLTRSHAQHNYHSTWGRYLTLRECLRLQGFPDDFDPPVTRAQLFRMVGNTMSVPVIAHLIGALLFGEGP